MAQQSVTSLGSGAGGSVREDLANFIFNIDRDETPLSSMAGSTKATSTYHDCCLLYTSPSPRDS